MADPRHQRLAEVLIDYGLVAVFVPAALPTMGGM